MEAVNKNQGKVMQLKYVFKKRWRRGYGVCWPDFHQAASSNSFRAPAADALSPPVFSLASGTTTKTSSPGSQDTNRFICIKEVRQGARPRRALKVNSKISKWILKDTGSVRRLNWAKCRHLSWVLLKAELCTVWSLSTDFLIETSEGTVATVEAWEDKSM